MRMSADCSVESLSRMVEPARVHRHLYTDPDIFELEMSRIFGTAWIYVGHESQVKNPGDYFCARMARKPLVIVRGARRPGARPAQPVRPSRRHGGGQ